MEDKALYSIVQLENKKAKMSWEEKPLANDERKTKKSKVGLFRKWLSLQLHCSSHSKMKPSWMFMCPKRTKLCFLLSDGCRWRGRECLSQLISHCFSAAHFIMTWAYHLLEHEEPLRAKIWSLASVLGLQTPVTLASLHHPIHPFSFLSINLPAW